MNQVSTEGEMTPGGEVVPVKVPMAEYEAHIQRVLESLGDPKDLKLWATARYDPDNGGLSLTLHAAGAPMTTDGRAEIGDDDKWTVSASLPVIEERPAMEKSFAAMLSNYEEALVNALKMSLARTLVAAMHNPEVQA